MPRKPSEQSTHPMLGGVLQTGDRVKLVLSMDGREVLWFYRRPGIQRHPDLGVSIRSAGVFIEFDRKRYQVGRPDRIWELCGTLLRAFEMESGCQDEVARLIRQFKLEEIRISGKILEDGQQRQTELLREIGWEKVPDSECLSHWRNVADRLKFDSRYCPGNYARIQPPDPFLTWSLRILSDQCQALYDAAGAYLGSANIEIRNITSSLNRDLMLALREIVSPETKIWALTYRHDCYEFDPWDVNVELHVAWWGVSVVMQDDFALFVRPDPSRCTPDLSCGIFFDPYECSLCAFGEPIRGRLAESMRAYDFTIIRESETNHIDGSNVE